MQGLHACTLARLHACTPALARSRRDLLCCASSALVLASPSRDVASSFCQSFSNADALKKKNVLRGSPPAYFRRECPAASRPRLDAPARGRLVRFRRQAGLLCQPADAGHRRHRRGALEGPWHGVHLAGGRRKYDCLVCHHIYYFQCIIIRAVHSRDHGMVSVLRVGACLESSSLVHSYFNWYLRCTTETTVWSAPHRRMPVLLLARGGHNHAGEASIMRISWVSMVVPSRKGLESRQMFDSLDAPAS